MLTTRIIPCLDVNGGRVVKGIKFKNLVDAGDPAKLAADYYSQGADELTFLDIGATHEKRGAMTDILKKVSDEVFIPITAGGGIKTIDDVKKMINAGADKVSICTAAVENPEIIYESADIFGSQCVVISVDAARVGKGWNVYTHGGRRNTGIDAIEWSVKVESMGAGEILLNSIDMDGTSMGYDIELIRKVSEAVSIPVIASGGGGTPEQMADAVITGKADAVLVASMLHYGKYTIEEIKSFLKEKGLNIRTEE